MILTRCGRANLSWDAAHRVLRHESKCRALHGHRYAATVVAEADTLDDVGRVVDFGAIKEHVGRWIDENLDHAAIVNPHDEALLAFVRAEGVKPPFVMPEHAAEPTAENIAGVLFHVAASLLEDNRAGLRVVRVKVWETPNCFATVDRAQDVDVRGALRRLLADG